MVVPAAIPALWCVMQEEVKFEVCLGYMVTCCLNKHTSKQTSHVLREETFTDIGLHTVYILFSDCFCIRRHCGINMASCHPVAEGVSPRCAYWPQV